ncbi:MAG TPA: sigma-54 dependent transcriptional regulator, partial [Terriglobales bacterium]|nr:sigma-54 dependent transcriptional regulator [Terriglobales bacterium]
MASTLASEQDILDVSKKRPAIKLLAIDDDPQNLELISEALQQHQVEISTATDPEQGLEIFSRIRPAIVLCDLMMPKISGMEVLERIVSIDPATEVILMTAHYSTDSAVEAIKKGAADYLTKPIELVRLRSRIATLIDEAGLRFRSAQLDQELVDTYRFCGIIGRSPLMLEMFAKIRRVAPHYRSALITGATGTGKELVARALHELSPAASKQFAVCNCSAVSESLVESELFGYVKGAFTGATQDKLGLFEYANGGTVFLDEIGEMPLNLQAKLLRVLQNREIQRVGSPAARKVDLRVVAATHRDLQALVKEGKFREDLFYRLSAVEITVPSLSQRREDLPLLEHYFIERFSADYNKPVHGMTRRAQALFSRLPWQGNVRELENAIAHACMMTSAGTIDVGDLPEGLRASHASESTES